MGFHKIDFHNKDYHNTVDTLDMVDNNMVDMDVDADLLMPHLKILPISHLQMEPQRILVDRDGNFCVCTLGLPPYLSAYYFICK